MSRTTRRRRVALSCTLLLALTALGADATSARPQPHAERDETIRVVPPVAFDLTEAGPLGSVSIIGDSVLQGAGRYAPTLPEQLSVRGWGPIRFRAGAGYSTGFFGRSFELTAVHWIERWRAEGWDADNVIVNIGANDTEFCATDVECSYRAITFLADAIGPGKHVWWPKVTKFFTHSPQAAAWNAALDRVADERDDFSTWDWPTELATGGYDSNDNTHIRPVSHPKRSLRIAEEFTADAARARRVGPPVNLTVPLGRPSSFVPTPAQRIVDTRDDPDDRLDAGTTLRIDLDDFVPDDTTAVSLYLAAVRQNGAGFLTAGPCGRTTETASVTFGSTAPAGASAIVRVTSDEGAAGASVCVDVGGPAGIEADVVVDLSGAFVSGQDGALLSPAEPPRRLADTRSGDPVTTLAVEAPFGASAVAVNVAATGATALGFATAGPCDNPPSTANLNYQPGPPSSASAIVEVGDDGLVCIEASAATHLVVDMTGSFASSSPSPSPPSSADRGLSLVPIDPLRVLDTRDGTGGWTPLHGRNQSIEVAAGPAWTDAMTGTITMVGPRQTGFLQADGCAGAPTNASVNASVGQVVANSSTTALSDTGTLCIRSSTITQTVVDVTGWWVATAP